MSLRTAKYDQAASAHQRVLSQPYQRVNRWHLDWIDGISFA
jgi:hypothetical protein